MITPSISTPIDVNTPIYFTANQGYFSYVWGGDVTGTGYQSNTVSFTTPGTYTVTVLICDEANCCGEYEYTFEVENECPDVTITSSSNSCTDITVTVTGGTGTKTYKVDGPQGTSIPLTSLPGGGVFTIDTSNVLAGEVIDIVVTVYVDNGTEICSKELTINYTRCNCLCTNTNVCQSYLDQTSGTNPGYLRDLGIFRAGTVFNWYFDPQTIADRLEIEYNGIKILDTGIITNNSQCQCNNSATCSCANFLGDVAQSTVIQIPFPAGFGNLNPKSSAPCSFDSTKPSRVIQLSMPAPLNTIRLYSLFGSLALDPLIAFEGLVTIRITGAACGSGGTAWDFGIICA